MNELIDKIAGTVGGVGDKFIALMPTNYTLIRWSAQVISATRYARVDGPILNAAGDSGAISSSPNIACVITRRGVLANRRSVGSLHLPYPDAETEATTGIVPAGFLSGMQDLCTQMLNNQTLAPSTVVFSPVLYHKTGLNFTDLVAAFPQRTIRVMRRRTVGVGS